MTGKREARDERNKRIARAAVAAIRKAEEMKDEKIDALRDRLNRYDYVLRQIAIQDYDAAGEEPISARQLANDHDAEALAEVVSFMARMAREVLDDQAG